MEHAPIASQPTPATLVNKTSHFRHWDAQQSNWMPNTKGNLVITSQHANKDIADDTAHVEKLMAKLKSLMLVHVHVLWLLLPLQAQYKHLLIRSQDPRL